MLIASTALLCGAAGLGADVGRLAVGRRTPRLQTSPGPVGIRDASWSPDGRRLAVSWFDAIWTMTPDGRDPKRVVKKAGEWMSERDPAWSPDGRAIAFSADTAGQFDLWVAPSNGGEARRVTSMPGDERWPSWTRDGRIVYSHRAPRAVSVSAHAPLTPRDDEWHLYAIGADGSGPPQKLTPDDQAEWQGRVSPDGKLVAFISDRDNPAHDPDIWVRELAPPAPTSPAAAPMRARLARVTAGLGAESYPAWANDGARVAYAVVRPGQPSAVWVSIVPPFGEASVPTGGRAGRLGGPAGLDGSAVLASRHGGAPAWSPDGRTLAIATFPTIAAGYNGNPNRNDDDPPTALAGDATYALWLVDAPVAVDTGAVSPAPKSAAPRRWTSAFDQVWQTLQSLYYTVGESAAQWDALRAKYRRQAAGATNEAAAEDAIDAMIADQPLIKAGLESTRAVVASGNPLASRAGALVLERGGNIVDAGIAVAFALGVVEPDATSIGGDGQAILFLKGMPEPVVIEYKDMTPGGATLDNARIFNSNGTRTASDGPTVANIPGVVAGLDLLYRTYGSKHVDWADLIAPAITLADEGFVLDEALPTSIAEGRSSFAKYPEAAKVFMPEGKIPKPGDLFVNKDYAATLRTLAAEGARSFYRGSIAQRIATDMAEHGGIISAEDLAQYRAMERTPLVGRYHGHRIYAAPPPVPTGAQLIETLNILDHYRPRAGASYTTDAEFLHYVIEAWRVRDGGGRIGDPERTTVDLGNHLDPAHALERFTLIDPRQVFVTQGGGRGGAPGPEPWPVSEEMNFEEETGPVQTGTTAFAVADVEGNMIAFTQTLSTWGGNYYVSKGLGFLYNDHFRGGGRLTQPLVRSSSTSVPTLVFAPTTVDSSRGGIPGFTPRMALGCAGNAWIPASVYNIITNVVDSGMTAQQAIEAPRLLIGNDGPTGRSRVQIEDRIPRALLADLEARGHSFTKVGRKGEVKYGYAAVVVVNAANGTVEGGAEPRRSHGTAAPRSLARHAGQVVDRLDRR